MSLVYQYFQYREQKEKDMAAFLIQQEIENAQKRLGTETGIEWEIRKDQNCIVTPPLSRVDALKLATTIPQQLFHSQDLGIEKSRSAAGFRIVLSLTLVRENLYKAQFGIDQNESIKIQWEDRQTCVVSNQISRHDAFRLALHVLNNCQDPFWGDDPGIVKSRKDGFRVIVQPEKAGSLLEIENIPAKVIHKP